MLFYFGRRRDFFVKKWFQTRIACYLLLLLLAGGAALAAATHHRALAALRYCLYRGHVVECSSWEVLHDEVVKTTLAAAGTIVLALAAAVFVISWSVTRAARAVGRNVRAAIGGQDPADWRPPPRPGEFEILQRIIADGLVAHQERIEETRSRIADVREHLQDARDDLGRDPADFAPGRLGKLHASLAGLRHYARFAKVD